MSNLLYLFKHLVLFPACLICLIYSPFVSFINFCHLINLSSSYQTSVIFSALVIYSLFTLSPHPINAPAVHTTHTTTLSPVLSCARSLCQYTCLTHQASLAIVPFWLWGESDRGWGFPHRTSRYVLKCKEAYIQEQKKRDLADGLTGGSPGRDRQNPTSETTVQRQNKVYPTASQIDVPNGLVGNPNSEAAQHGQNKASEVETARKMFHAHSALAASNVRLYINNQTVMIRGLAESNWGVASKRI